MFQFIILTLSLSFLSFDVQIAAAPLQPRAPQSSGSVTGECLNAQLDANRILPQAISAFEAITSDLPPGALRTGLEATRSGLNKALPGLQRVSESVENGTETKVENLNAIAEGLVGAEIAFYGIRDNSDIKTGAKDILDQALAAGQAVINNCL